MYYEYIDIIPLQLGNQSIRCPFKSALLTIEVTFSKKKKLLVS
jgi:hypothetical protein